MYNFDRENTELLEIRQYFPHQNFAPYSMLAFGQYTPGLTIIHVDQWHVTDWCVGKTFIKVMHQ